MNTPFTFVMLMLAASPVLAVDSQAVADTQYQYGMHLDIAEVVSITTTPGDDAVYPATLEYIDPQGQTNHLVYSVTDISWGGQ